MAEIYSLNKHPESGQIYCLIKNQTLMDRIKQKQNQVIKPNQANDFYSNLPNRIDNELKNLDIK